MVRTVRRPHTDFPSCIVIPGWGGHPIGSFMAEDSPYLWVLDGLGSDFPQLRVWTYGYGSNLMQQGPCEDIYEFADSFVRSLRHLRLDLGVTSFRCFGVIVLMNVPGYA